MRLEHGFATALLALGAAGCIDMLEPGEIGNIRYVGDVEGKPPLDLLPPTFDREGNVYVLYGSPSLKTYQGFVGSSGGNWSTFLEPTIKGDKYGVHGWIGHTFQQAFFWAGDSLINVDGFGRNHYRYLETDPNTGANLVYRAVIPWIKETASTTTLLAFIQSSTDKVPFAVVVNLDTGLYANAHRFSPSNATDLAILGVGADRETERGVVVVRYGVGDDVRVEARFLDADAGLVATAAVSGGDDLAEYAFTGFLKGNEKGLFAGVSDQGHLITCDEGGGRIRGVKGMTPVGVHQFEGALWLVGTTNGDPVVARIEDDGTLGEPSSWTASRTAASNLNQTLPVIDDRRLPSHSTEWKAKNAMGDAPFLTPYNPETYAEDETGWLIAGPNFDFSGQPRTAIGFAPVGISYP